MSIQLCFQSFFEQGKTHIENKFLNSPATEDEYFLSFYAVTVVTEIQLADKELSFPEIFCHKRKYKGKLQIVFIAVYFD